MDGKYEKLHLPMVFPALLCGIYGLSDWMQIKWMGKFNTLKLKSAFEFPEGTSQPEARRRGAPGCRFGPAQAEGSREDLLLHPAAPGRKGHCLHGHLPCSLPN